MASCRLFLIAILFTSQAFAGGMPVIDTNELLKQISDALYMTTALNGLLSEVGGDGVSAGAIQSLQSELNLYQGEIENYQTLRGAIDDTSDFPIERSRVFVKQVENITSYIRKVKMVVELGASFGARPEAVSASLAMMRNQQEQERLRTETALRVLDEKEKIRQQRMKLRKRSLMSQAIASEISDIRRFSGGKTVAPVEARAGSKNSKRLPLW